MSLHWLCLANRSCVTDAVCAQFLAIEQWRLLGDAHLDRDLDL